MREVLDAAGMRQWCTAGLAALRRREHEINQLNVYPVPDGDTGTNLVRTLAAAWEALTDAREPAALEEPPAGTALRRLARGALLGARGNSGVILAQMLRGLADVLGEARQVSGPALADAFTAAAKAGYTAVAVPVEGTILSVASVVRTAADAAAAALARTPGQLPVLATAGVVDAGGQGLLVLLDTLVEVVTGVPPQRARPPAPAIPVGAHAYEPDDRYEVQYLLDAEAPAVGRLREVLTGLGDSLVVADAGQGTWHVHVHVADAGAAVEAGIMTGRLHQISVTRLVGQTDPGPAASASPPAPSQPPRAARATVVVATGDGLADLFRSEGAVVVAGPPSTREVLAAIRVTGAGEVVVLPNDPDGQAVATAAAAEAAREEIRVSVVPTRSPVQALAALAVRDPGRRFDDDVIAMAEAAGACRYAQVCRAGRDALTMVGRCRAGDVLALVEGEVHLIGADLAEVSVRLLDRLLGGGGELVSLVIGAEAPDDLTATLTTHLTTAWPFVEVQVYPGGQPHYPLLVGVE